jgi:hypothetical protein
MWLAAREAQYVNYLGRLAPAEPLETPWDTTNPTSANADSRS